MTDTKDDLARYLRAAREALLWKCEGLEEYDLRLPRTPTGTNLLGLVKHCAIVEHGYLVTCVGRTSDVAMPECDWDADPNIDLYATADETVDEILALHRAVAAAADATIAALPLDAPAHVPWWGARADTTLGRLLIHVIAELHRHAGHADILREGIDGLVGLGPANPNMADDVAHLPAHHARLTELAERTR